MERLLIFLIFILPISALSGEIEGKIKSITSIIESCYFTNKRCAIVELKEKINNSPSCTKENSSFFVIELPKNDNHSEYVYQQLSMSTSLDYFVLKGKGECFADSGIEILETSEKIGMRLNPPIGNGFWRVTYPYNYKTHICYGNYFKPNSSKGNPACDTYALDFMPLDCKDKYNRVGKEGIHSVEDGTIVFAKEQGRYGNTVLINHGSGVYSRYAHLDSIEDRIEENLKVRAGTLLGKAGDTTSGSSIGKHLHFSMYKVENESYTNSFKPEPLGGITDFDIGIYSNKIVYVAGKNMQYVESCSP